MFTRTLAASSDSEKEERMCVVRACMCVCVRLYYMYYMYVQAHICHIRVRVRRTLYVCVYAMRYDIRFRNRDDLVADVAYVCACCCELISGVYVRSSSVYQCKHTFQNSIHRQVK